MIDNKSSVSRRKLLKSIAAGSGVVIAGKSLPESWSKPVVDSVVLPAHAQTSVVEYSITVQVSNSANDQCGSGGETANITGTVSASNGANLTGVQLNIHYTDNPPDGDYADLLVTVQAGNTYSFSGVVVADVGHWNRPPYTVTVTFVNQATYGTASATADGACGNPAPPLTTPY